MEEREKFHQFLSSFLIGIRKDRDLRSSYLVLAVLLLSRNYSRSRSTY
jgi:hypothetical protein